MELRSRLALSGGLGVVGGAALTGGAVFLFQREIPSPLISGYWAWLLLAFLVCFSVAEIPVMILGMRQVVKNAPGRGLVELINFNFIFFAAVYATPFLLLTGSISIGVGLAGLGLLRLIGALVFVPGAQQAPRR
jgi:hypothetical protein